MSPSLYPSDIGHRNYCVHRIFNYSSKFSVMLPMTLLITRLLVSSAPVLSVPSASCEGSDASCNNVAGKAQATWRF